MGEMDSDILGPHRLCCSLSPWLPPKTPPLLWGQGHLEAALWGHLSLWERGSSDQHCCGSFSCKLNPDILHPHLLAGLANEPPMRTGARPWLLAPPTLLWSSFTLAQPWGVDLRTSPSWTRLSMFDTVLTPMWNLLIYSLRNREVVGLMREVLEKDSTENRFPCFNE